MSATHRVQDNIIEIRRAVRAKPSRVFAAWTSAEALDAWWGPDGFRNETRSFDFRPGGSWVFVMRHPEHGDYDNHVRFVEIEAPKRLVYEHVDGDEVLFRSTVTFESVGERETEVCLRLEFPSVEACRATLERVDAIAGGKQTLGHLAAAAEAGVHTLDIQPEGERSVLISRRFATTAARLWRAHTDPDAIQAWMGTPRYPMTACSVDLRVGGTFRYTWGDGEQSMAVAGTFLELDPPRRIVHEEVFDDDWTGGPARVETTFDEKNGVTTLHMHITYSSGEARGRVLEAPLRDGMDTNYDNLERVLD